MKKLLCTLLALAVMLGMFAGVSQEVGAVYTDVTTMLTQDSVLGIEIFTENENSPLSVTLREPNEESVALLEKVFDFVWREKNPPVRYFDVETQQKIQLLVPEVDIDTLHMSEFMGQGMEGEPTEEIRLERTLEADYEPGQLLVVVLGILQEDGEYRWFPYRAEAPSVGVIRYEMPAEDYLILNQAEQVIYTVLTDKEGPGGNLFYYEEIATEGEASPSKTAEDVIRIRKWKDGEGNTVENDFKILIVDKTQPMLTEIEGIAQYLISGENENVLGWFPEEVIREAQLLVGENARVEEMLVYDIVAVMAENYRDTYGDVTAEIIFASAFSEEKEMFALLGFPKEENIPEEGTRFDWVCLRAEAVGDAAEISFKQLVLPEMEKQPAILLVFSLPLDN